MRVIGVDTTTKAFCMALVQDTSVLERLVIDDGGYHAEDLVAHLENILKRQKMGKDDIDGYAISIGPGSLTGVRVGLAFLKGLGYATGKPVIPVETLYAIAFEARKEAECVCPVLLTRRQQLFWALYLFSRVPPLLVEASCTSIEELLKEMPPEREILFLGTGVHAHRMLIEERMGQRARFGKSAIGHPDAAVIAMIGLQRIREGDIPEIGTLEPIYV